jgi:hypothetical protein
MPSNGQTTSQEAHEPMNLELEFTRIPVAWEEQEKLACNLTAPYVM